MARNKAGSHQPLLALLDSLRETRTGIYLASPYTHADTAVVSVRVRRTEHVVANMLRSGLIVYSPIVHCHAIAHTYALPKDHTFWQRYNFAMLDIMQTFAILTLDGWQESRGVSAETAYALGRGKQIIQIAITDSNDIKSFANWHPHT